RSVNRHPARRGGLIVSTLDYPIAAGVSCETCGAEAVGFKAHANGFDYCRNCYYTGRAYAALRGGQISALETAMPGWTVSVDHTGGGCFWMSFTPPDSGGYFYAATDGEST